MSLDEKPWFQLLTRLWRPFQQWGFAIAAVIYAFRPIFEMSFQVETFAALAAAGGVGFIGRGIEKAAKHHSEQKYSQYDRPDGEV